MELKNCPFCGGKAGCEMHIKRSYTAVFLRKGLALNVRTANVILDQQP